VVYGNFNYNFSPISSKKGKYMLFTPKGNVMLAVRSERADHPRTSPQLLKSEKQQCRGYVNSVYNK
jgi:hypothetical protein